jgi:LPS sulfotransferase NodH
MTSKGLTYVVCATPRVGSTHLCEALGRVPGAGAPQEWFGRPRIHQLAGRWGLRSPESTVDDPKLTDPPRFLEHVRTEAESSGVLALKVHWNQIEWARSHLGLDPMAMVDGRGDVRFVRLYRDDLIAQTVSSFIASVTKVYVRRAEGQAVGDDEFVDVARATPRYDFELLLSVFEELASIEYGWGPFFQERGTVPHTLSYEELDSDLPGAVNGVLDYLGLPRQEVVTSPMAPQRTAVNRAMADQFRQDLRRRGIIDDLPADLRRRCRISV